MPLPSRPEVVLLLLTHSLSLAVWIGVMLFNLIVNFPAQRARAASIGELMGSMGAQARRAAPWLYILIVLTALSGAGLRWMEPQSLGSHGAQIVSLKWAALAAMTLLHLWGSMRVWPRMYFALDSERPALFIKYQVAMAMSAALGIGAMALSYSARYL